MKRVLYWTLGAVAFAPVVLGIGVALFRAHALTPREFWIGVCFAVWFLTACCWVLMDPPRAKAFRELDEPPGVEPSAPWPRGRADGAHIK